MSGKVISLAERRHAQPDRGPLDIQWSSDFEAPVSREKYDAWIEIDGSLVIRIDADHASYKKTRAEYGPDGEGPTVFTARGNSYEVRFAAEKVREFFNDMSHMSNTSRKRLETLRGVHSWLCTPLADGSFSVKHAFRTSVFVAFRPRRRKVLGPIVRMEKWGPVRDPEWIMVAPNCDACSRVMQIGETAYRERSNPNGRNFADAVICSGCIKNGPRTGLQEVQTDSPPPRVNP